jgi:hypothetical protein
MTCANDVARRQTRKGDVDASAASLRYAAKADPDN